MILKIWRQTKDLILRQLKQGSDPRGLALSCAIGFIFGSFPIMGTTTILCFLTVYFLRLNQPAAQAVNYLMAPIQLILIPVFLKSGAWLWGNPAVSLNPATITRELYAHPGLFLARYGLAALEAAGVWVIYAASVGTCVFLLFWSIFIRLRGTPALSSEFVESVPASND